MKTRLAGAILGAALTALWAASVACQELPLGYLPSGAGPFATFSKTNEIAAQMAIDEINAAGGIGGKKLRIVAFDTAGKPDQAVVGVRKLADRAYVLELGRVAMEGPPDRILADQGLQAAYLGHGRARDRCGEARTISNGDRIRSNRGEAP